MKKLVLSAFALLAAMSLSAQDLTAIYNDAAAAFGAKDFAKAAQGFEKVIDQGMDSEEAAGLVATAKSTIPKCYFFMGGNDVKAKKYDEALKDFSKSAEMAELYGDTSQMARAKQWVAKIYQLQGADAFNNKDYVKAAEVFAMGYAADNRNMDMALNLAMSYSESGNYAKGMEVYEEIAALDNPKYVDSVAKAKEMMALYTNNEVAKMQAENNLDGIITMADAMLEKNPASPLAQKIRLQAYVSKNDHAKVIELGSTTAEAQTDADDKSLMYYLLGASHNAKEQKPQAIAAFQKVVAGPAMENAKKALAELQK